MPASLVAASTRSRNDFRTRGSVQAEGVPMSPPLTESSLRVSARARVLPSTRAAIVAVAAVPNLDKKPRRSCERISEPVLVSLGSWSGETVGDGTAKGAFFMVAPLSILLVQERERLYLPRRLSHSLKGFSLWRLKSLSFSALDAVLSSFYGFPRRMRSVSAHTARFPTELGWRYFYASGL